MKPAKRTYALPSDTVARFESLVGPGQRSARIAEWIETWMRERERERLRREIIEGCREMNDILLETAREWANDQLWRSIEP